MRSVEKAIFEIVSEIAPKGYSSLKQARDEESNSICKVIYECTSKEELNTIQVNFISNLANKLSVGSTKIVLSFENQDVAIRESLDSNDINSLKIMLKHDTLKSIKLSKGKFSISIKLYQNENVLTLYCKYNLKGANFNYNPLEDVMDNKQDDNLPIARILLLETELLNFVITANIIENTLFESDSLESDIQDIRKTLGGNNYED